MCFCFGLDTIRPGSYLAGTGLVNGRTILPSNRRGIARKIVRYVRVCMQQAQHEIVWAGFSLWRETRIVPFTDSKQRSKLANYSAKEAGLICSRNSTMPAQWLCLVLQLSATERNGSALMWRCFWKTATMFLLICKPSSECSLFAITIYFLDVVN